jgi:uncharacterized phage protein gp47/JayE
MLDSLLAGGILTDANPTGVARQDLEGFSAGLADLSYDVWLASQTLYIGTATDTDLGRLGRNYGLARDAGQAASDLVTFTRALAWLDDLTIPAQVLVQATIADGTAVLYRTIQTVVLGPQGRSVSGIAPATLTTGGAVDRVVVNLDGDGPRTLTLGSLTGGSTIAAALQAAVRALTALTPGNQPAYAGFRCDYQTTTPGAYTLRTGTTGPGSSVVVTDAGTNNAALALKLGVAHGGTEAVGQDSADVPVLCNEVGVIGNIGAGQIAQLLSPIPGVVAVANALAFSNGRERASDDAYRQDIRDWLQSLGTGTEPSLERAVYQTRGADGQRHVLSMQATYGPGLGRICLTVGCQESTRLDVENNLRGLGVSGRPAIPAGMSLGVVPAQVVPVDVLATVTLGPTPDLARAQQALEATLYEVLYGWPLGGPLTYAQVSTLLDRTVIEVLSLRFDAPSAFWPSGSQTLPAVVGRKYMPGRLAITCIRVS